MRFETSKGMHKFVTSRQAKTYKEDFATSQESDQTTKLWIRLKVSMIIKITVWSSRYITRFPVASIVNMYDVGLY